MRTDDLVGMLATGEGPVESGATTRRYAIALGGGVVGATLLMVPLLGLRSDLFQAMRLPMFWVKLAFPASLGVAALYAATRLSRPGRSLGRVPAGLAAPVLAMWLLAAFALIDAAPPERRELLFGQTARVCPLLIAMLSLPTFALVLWAMRQLAPTRLALAGASAGLLAGTVGTFVYAFHCAEMGAPFLATWYLLGMLIPTAAGALIGPRWLRW